MKIREGKHPGDLKLKFYYETQLHVYKIPKYPNDNGIIPFNE